MSAARPPLPCLSTGSAAFDAILGGGLPARSVNVIAGEPGAGKTLFALQMLFDQARQGKKGLYLTTLSEPSLKLINYMQQFSFFDERLIADKRVVFADLGSVIRRKGVDATLAEIIGRVEREEPALVVIDSFKAIRDLLGDAPAMRTFVYDLAVHVGGWGATSLLVGEYTADGDRDHRGVRHRRRHHPVRATAAHELRAIREVEVVKLRGANVRDRRSLLRDRPATVWRSSRACAARTARSPSRRGSTQRAPTGVAGLDDMLGGGLPRASATVVQGGTGTGKTMLGLQFLLEGARQRRAGHSLRARGDRRISSVASPRCFGWDLRAAGRARAPHLPLHLTRRALDRSLPRSRRGTRWSGSARAAPCSTA